MGYTVDTYDLTPDQVNLKNQAHRFAEEVMRPASMELDPLSPEEVIAPDSRMWDVLKASYRAGYHLRGFPEQLGGSTLGPVEQSVMSEELGWGSAGLSIAMGVASFPFRFAAMVGNPDLMKEMVLPFVEDKDCKLVGCWCATEPQHGSDAILYNGPDARPDIHFECYAKQDGDSWVINGQKSAWVSNGTIATHTLAFLCVDPSKGMAGTGVAVVPLTIPGVTKGKPLDKIGQRALNQGEIFFDNVRIPAHYMLATPEMFALGGGDSILAGANAGMSATFSGVARAAFEEALSYCQQRVQGGVPLVQHQLVQRKLMDMFIRLESARALSRKALLRLATGQPTIHYSIAAKVYCTETAFTLASDAIQLHGGMGLVKGILVEQLMRDARAAMIEDGANDVLALAGARTLVQ